MGEMGKEPEALGNYFIRDMRDWRGVGADVVVTDPPFGIGFSGKRANYRRDERNVVSGYVEWPVDEYPEMVRSLLRVMWDNLKDSGQGIIFSGWNNSGTIHEMISESRFKLQGKLYWVYNFAPASRIRPSHNVYEIFWVTKSKKWTYNKRCSTHHCTEGEPNLSSLIFKREYRANMPKYPTMLPLGLLTCIIEHFSNRGDLIFDPLAGSGMVGIAASLLKRRFVLGDINKNGKIIFRELAGRYLGT